MKEDNRKTKKISEIRKKAEEELQAKTDGKQKPSIRDAAILIHELQVHQIELEMQNEELIRVQKELEESRDKYSDLYDFSPVGYLSFDKDGLILESNLTAAKILGVERNLLINKPFSLFLSPDTKDVFYQHLRQVFSTGVQHTCELNFFNNNGVELCVQLISILVGICSTCRTSMSDITDRKKAEQSIKNALVYTESIVDTIREPLILLDSHKRFISANTAFYQTFKTSIEEVKGRSIYELGNGQWNIPRLRKLLWKMKSINSRVQDLEITQVFPNIGEKVMLLNASRLKLVGTDMILLAIEDITFRRQLENFYHENESLIRVNKARSDFLMIMSHELRTPLTSVIAYSILLKEKKNGELSEKQQLFVDTILKSSKHLLDLINDFLELAKIEAGKLEMFFEEIYVPEVIDEILEIISENAIQHDIILKKEFYQEKLSIKADRRALKQILFNLVTNAIKFSKNEGGIITISTKREDDMVKISVADNGIGIKEEDLSKLFQKFEQLDPGLSRKYEGTGLGLVITKQLIEMQGGKIWVESKPGKGSKFIFMLPIEGTKIKNQNLVI